MSNKCMKCGNEFNEAPGVSREGGISICRKCSEGEALDAAIAAGAITKEQAGVVQNELSASERIRVFNNPKEILGRTIHFVDKIDCKSCPEYDFLRRCDKQNSEECSLEIHTVEVEEIAYSRCAGALEYKINEMYSFYETAIRCEIFFELEEAEAYLKKITKE